MEEKTKIVVVGQNQELDKAIVKETTQGGDFEVIDVGEEKIKVPTEKLDYKKSKEETLKKFQESREKISLPVVGTVFSINGQMFRITYVNKGKKRLSIEPVI